jgi:hypothetical protein
MADTPSHKPRLDKLGVKPGARVSVLDVDDPGFLAELRTRTGEVHVGRPRRDSDLVFVFISHRDELERVRPLKKYLRSNGAIWVLRPKGTPHIKEVDIIDLGKRSGLVDNKIASFSDTVSAMRLVIPVALRGSARRDAGDV